MGLYHNECVVACINGNRETDPVIKWIQALPRYKQEMFFISQQLVNSHINIFLMPCGSKVGWPEYADNKQLREEFIALINSHAYDDGSNSYSYAEVGFGELGESISGNNRNMWDYEHDA